MVKNLPCNVGDASSIPGRGTKIRHTLEQLRLCATATEAQHPPSGSVVLVRKCVAVAMGMGVVAGEGVRPRPSGGPGFSLGTVETLFLLLFYREGGGKGCFS